MIERGADDHLCADCPGTQSALAAAVLVELVGTGRVAVDDDDDPPIVSLVDGLSTGEPVLDAALSALAEREPVPTAIERVMPGLHVRLLDRLAERRIFTRRARNHIPLASKFVWRVADTARREQLRGWLAAVLDGHTPRNQWSAALISLLYALDAVDVVVGGPDAVQRAEEISQAGWTASSVVHPVIDRSHLFADFSGMPGPSV